MAKVVARAVSHTRRHRQGVMHHYFSALFRTTAELSSPPSTRTRPVNPGPQSTTAKSPPQASHHTPSLSGTFSRPHHTSAHHGRRHTANLRHAHSPNRQCPCTTTRTRKQHARRHSAHSGRRESRRRRALVHRRRAHAGPRILPQLPQAALRTRLAAARPGSWICGRQHRSDNRQYVRPSDTAVTDTTVTIDTFTTTANAHQNRSSHPPTGP